MPLHLISNHLPCTAAAATEDDNATLQLDSLSGSQNPADLCLEKVKLPAERVLHIDHLFARMQRLNA